LNVSHLSKKPNNGETLTVITIASIVEFFTIFGIILKPFWMLLLRLIAGLCWDGHKRYSCLPPFLESVLKQWANEIHDMGCIGRKTLFVKSPIAEEVNK